MRPEIQGKDCIILHRIRWSESGRRVDFEAKVTGAAAKFFSGLPPMFVRYEEDLSATPDAVSVIAWLGNVLPIAWLGGIEVSVPELDAVFAAAEPELKKQFALRYPGCRLDGRLRADKLVEVQRLAPVGPPLMLFSGGLDAMATFLRHRDERPVLVTVLGGDIRLDQTREWRECLEHIRGEAVLETFEHVVVESNLRTFYHLPMVERHLYHNWWGSVQYGLGFVALLAPLAHHRGAPIVYIASSLEGVTGTASTFAVDSCIRWSGTACGHDSAGVPRPAKAGEILHAARRVGAPIRVRVCWQQPEGWLNCGRCEKCLRTAINFVAHGANPESFGIPMAPDFYPELFRGLARMRRKDALELVWQENVDAIASALAVGDAFVRPGFPEDRRWLVRIAAGEPVRLLRLNRTSLGRKWKRLCLKLGSWLPRLDPGRLR